MKIFLETLKSWYEAPNMAEKGIESFLRMSLFNGILGYQQEQMLIQEGFEDPSSEKKNIPDIILKPTKSIEIPVEIKKPISGSTAMKSGRRQVANYAKLKGGRFGILTDGKRWEVIAVHNRLWEYKIVWSHEVDYSSKLSRLFFAQLTPTKIMNFLTYADRMFNTITYQKLIQVKSMAAMNTDKDFYTLIRAHQNVSRDFVKLLNLQMDIYAHATRRKDLGKKQHFAREKLAT